MFLHYLTGTNVYESVHPVRGAEAAQKVERCTHEHREDNDLLAPVGIGQIPCEHGTHSEDDHAKGPNGRFHVQPENIIQTFKGVVPVYILKAKFQ